MHHLPTACIIAVIMSTANGEHTATEANIQT